MVKSPIRQSTKKVNISEAGEDRERNVMVHLVGKYSMHHHHVGFIAALLPEGRLSVGGNKFKKPSSDPQWHNGARTEHGVQGELVKKCAWCAWFMILFARPGPALSTLLPHLFASTLPHLRARSLNPSLLALVPTCSHFWGFWCGLCRCRHT